MSNRIKSILKYVLIAAVWIALWMIAALAVGEPLLLPSPDAVLMRLGELMISSDFYLTIALSLLRVVTGTVCGILIGTLGGALCAACRVARDFFSPALAVIKSTPVASFIILLVLWMSRDVAPAVISAIVVIPIVWSNVEMGIRTADKALVELALAYKMPISRKLGFVYLPSVRPHFISALRSSVGMSWKAGIAAEVLLVPALSVGKQIFEAKYSLLTVDLFAWTVAVVVISVIIEWLTLAVFDRTAKKGG
jgi:NitT/TauT family transport system permease protein